MIWDMKRLWLIISICVFAVCIAGCKPNQGIDRLKHYLRLNTPTVDIRATEFKYFEFEDSRTACRESGECVLMRAGGCEGVQSIHESQVEFAKEYTTYVKTVYPNVVCAPGLPIEEYESLCLNQKCMAVSRNYRLLLEVPEQPVAEKPFWIGISFRFHVDIEEVEARFILPEHIRVLEGQTSWRGKVKALEDYVMWIRVQTDQPGEVYLTGWTKIQKGDPGIPPLSMSEKFMVNPQSLSTEQPGSEWILQTPTPEN